MRYLKTFESFEVEQNEGFGDFVKKAVGQLKTWKLDGSYLEKASKEAKSYLTTHPAAKVMVKSLMKYGLDQKQAEEATLRIKDWGGRPEPKSIKFDAETQTLTLEPSKGVSGAGGVLHSLT